MGKNRERKGKGERKERDFRERSSTFSLDFPIIGQANSGETRRKVDPHCKSYAWVLILWISINSGEVGVFSYLFYSLVKNNLMDRDILRPGWLCFLVPKDLDSVKKSLECFFIIPNCKTREIPIFGKRVIS